MLAKVLIFMIKNKLFELTQHSANGLSFHYWVINHKRTQQQQQQIKVKETEKQLK